MSKVFKIVILYLLIFPIFTTNNLAKGSTVLTGEKKATIDIFVDSIYKVFEIPGLSIVATKGGDILYENNLGYRELPTDSTPGILLERNDLFRIASISKTFVATTVFKLIEEGKISLGDDAQIYLPFKLRNPNFPDVPITIDMLLTHTSSINDKKGYTTFDIINPSKNIDYFQCYSDYKPGEKYNYCNFNFNILGGIIETLTGQRFDEYIDEKIFTPLNINAAFDNNKLDYNRLVKLYEYNGKTHSYQESTDAYRKKIEELQNYKLGETSAILSGCGGVKISTLDLSKFLNMHLYNGTLNGIRIISEDSENMMRKDFPGINNNYGHTISRYSGVIPGKILYGQTGSAYGLRSVMLFDPETSFGVVIISSGATCTISEISSKVHIPITQKIFNAFNSI